MASQMLEWWVKQNGSIIFLKKIIINLVSEEELIGSLYN